MAEVRDALMDKPEQFANRQQYLHKASQLWRNRGHHAKAYYFPSSVDKKTAKAAKVTIADDASEGYDSPTTPRNRVVADVRAVTAPQPQTVVPLTTMFAQPPWMHSMMPQWPYGYDVGPLMQQQHQFAQLQKLYNTPVLAAEMKPLGVTSQLPVQSDEQQAKRGRNDQGRVHARAQGPAQGNTNPREDFKRARHENNQGPRNRAYDQDRNRYNNGDRWNNGRNYNNNNNNNGGNNGYRDRNQAPRNNYQDSDRRDGQNH